MAEAQTQDTTEWERLRFRDGVFLNDTVRHQAKNLGVARVLEKPVDIRLLRQALDELLPLAAARLSDNGGTSCRGPI